MIPSSEGSKQITYGAKIQINEDLLVYSKIARFSREALKKAGFKLKSGDNLVSYEPDQTKDT